MLNGKPVRYESPRGRPNRAYFPPGTRVALRATTAPLLITEGEKKAAKADQEGFPCIGLVGVYGWQRKRPKGADGKAVGPRALIPDLAAVAWAGRAVYLVFDSDLADKPEVRRAERHLAEVLRGAGADVRVVRLPGGSGGTKVGLDDFLLARGADALRDLLSAAAPGEPAETDSRPTIAIGTDEHRVNEHAAAALAAEPDLYQRGGLLVQVLAQEADSSPDAMIRRPAGAPAVRELARPLLRERLTRCARWVRVKPVGDGRPTEVPAHPPDWCVAAVHARGRWPEVHRLGGVVTHPVILNSGEVLATSGYHPSAELLVCLPAGLRIDVPECPTSADVAAAVATLTDPLADFPFADDTHKAALVAGLLTPLAWYLFDGPAPLFLIDKNVRGAGAGLLADVVSLTVNRTTIIGLLVMMGERCERLLEGRLKNLPVVDVQCDEVWGFVGMKEKTRKRTRPDATDVGDAYCFTAIERDTKLLVAWHLGIRSKEDTEAFADKLAAATTGQFQITTDGFKPYANAIPGSMPLADFAILIKQYATKADEGRYSPGEVTGTVKTPCCGSPDPARICTSHVERSNLTVRMGNRRMTRLTNAFSKKWENHQASLALTFAYYNFCRVHSTLKKTPAMAAGLEDHPWTLAELIQRSSTLE